jgi:xanthine dehydrogenase accessory factor
MEHVERAMGEIYEDILKHVRAGQPVVVATIVRTRGSTPREVGAKMLIGSDGKSSGTIGGGCGEAEVGAHALEVLASGEPKLVKVDLLSDTDDEGGRACGGIMYVHLERVDP